MVTPMQHQEGEIARGPNGETAVFRGGQWVVQSSAPSAGPRQAVPGLIQLETPAQRAQAEERVYDRQRDTVRDARADRTEERAVDAAARQAQAAERSAGNLTDKQGDSLQYGTMMRGAEADYQRARANGYDPTSFRNSAATLLDGIPFDRGLVPALIRDDQSDAGYQAERRWASANLRQMSGAAFGQNEVTDIANINFDRANDTLADQRYRTRQDTYGATRLAAGSARDQLPEQYPAQSNPAGGTGANGLPTYPGIAAASSGITETPTPDGGYGIDPNAPGGPNSPIDLGSLGPEDLLGLKAGQFVRRADGTVYALPSAPFAAPAQPGDVREGSAVIRPQSPDQIVADRQEGNGFVRGLDAGVRGAADALTFGFADEIAAGLNTALPLDRGSRFGDYEHNIAMQRGIDRADAKDVPLQRGAGQVAGGLAGGLAVAPRAAALVTRPLISQVGRGIGAGAAYGGAYGLGSGEGNALERAPSAAMGAALGAAAGGAAPVAVNALSRVATPIAGAVMDGARVVARPVVNALGDNAPAQARAFVQPNALARGLDRFAGNNRPNVNALSGRAAQLEQDIGRPVPLIDAVNTGGRGVMRGAALRSDGARQVAEDFATGRVEALPQRMSQQARSIVSDDRRSPDQIREALTERRSGLAREEYAAPYAQPVTMDDQTVSALQGAPGRAAIRKARSDAETWRQPEVVAELDGLEAWAAGGFTGPRPQISAGALDGIHQAMTGRASRLAQNPNTRRAGAGVFDRAGDVDKALDNVEGLGAARGTYRDITRQIEALDNGEAFLSGNPDEIIAAMEGASPEAQAAFRAAAARSIERAAGTTGGAPGVANRLAVPGTPQRQVMDATLGEADAARLANASRGERDLVRNANRANPGQGSNTNPDQVDTARAAGTLARGRPIAAAVDFVVDKIRSRGFSPAEAEAFLRAAQDPSQTQELINGLARRMNRREARNLARTLTYQSTRGLQSDPQS